MGIGLHRINRVFRKRSNFYHIHIPKTAGTSINKSFLDTLGDPDQLYSELANSDSHKIEVKGKLVVGWNKYELENNSFYYGFSHKPFHTLNFKRPKVLFSIIREPVERALSYYRMFRNLQLNNIQHTTMQQNLNWKGQSFDIFIRNIPAENLNFQTYTFSSKLDPNEAVKTVKDNEIVLLDFKELRNCVKKFNDKYALQLSMRHDKNNSYSEDFSERDMVLLKKKLKPDIKLYQLLRDKDLLF